MLNLSTTVLSRFYWIATNSFETTKEKIGECELDLTKRLDCCTITSIVKKEMLGCFSFRNSQFSCLRSIFSEYKVLCYLMVFRHTGTPHDCCWLDSACVILWFLGCASVVCFPVRKPCMLCCKVFFKTFQTRRFFK